MKTLVVTKPHGRRTAGKAASSHQEAFIATLGVEPQVITRTLARLLDKGCRIGQVRVVHTFGKPVQHALSLVQREFDTGIYPDIVFYSVPVEGDEGPVEDFRVSDDVGCFLRVLYREVRKLRRAGYMVHLSISGGRKVMAVAGMVVAQLLFGPEDKVWHILTERWTPGGERQMHLPQEEPVWLVQVPVLRWADSPAMLSAIAELGDPMDAIRRYEELIRSGRMRRRREFVSLGRGPSLDGGNADVPGSLDS